MKILICGTSGFVGRHLEQALKAADHKVTRGIRKPKCSEDLAISNGKHVSSGGK